MKKIHLAFFVLLFLFVAITFASLRTSIIFSPRDRINVVLYGNPATFYSIGKGDGTDYKVTFSPDFKASIAGGYGKYRLGGLGKLVSLEHKPELIGRTFSLLTDSFVDLYFYPISPEIYFGEKSDSPQLPTLSAIFFANSNASFFDKAYISWLFLQNPPRGFTRLPADLKQEGNFYNGYWYDKTYRDEREIIQILYTNSYTSAQHIGNLLEGMGIRVSDVSLAEYKGKCVIIVKKNSKTSSEIARFFNCLEKIGDTGLYDILIKLGDIEGNWET